MQCTNNVKQLSLASLNYESAHKVFHALGHSGGGGGAPGMGSSDGMVYSWTMAILPYIEQAPLQEAFNARARPNGVGLPVPWDTGNDAWLNQYWKLKIPSFLCPSDSPPTSGEIPCILNYRASVGDDYHQNHFRPDQGRDNRGIFQLNRYLGMGAITDGTSNTILFGESISGGAPNDVLGGVALLMQSWAPAGCIARIDPANRRTITAPVRADFRPPGGRAWDGRPYFSAVATMVPPNGPSCHWGDVDGNEHMATLSSRHTGGAIVGLCDGSVRFLSQNISAGDPSIPDVEAPGSRQSPWGVLGALGSRSGGESFSID